MSLLLELPIGPRILFVDDEPPIRSAFLRLFKGKDYIVDLAASGEEALALAARHRYSVIATDLRMPKMSGFALIQKARRLQPQARLIVITGVREIDPAELCANEDGIVALVRKPWVNSELLSTVENLCRALPAPLHSSMPPVSLSSIEVLLLGAGLDRIPEGLRSYRAHRIRTAMDEAEAVRTLLERPADLVFVGPLFQIGVEPLAAIKAAAPQAALVIVSSELAERSVLLALKAGAQECLGLAELTPDLVRKATRFALERKKVERRVVHEAHYDQLTGLSNQNLFLDRITYSVMRAKQTSGRFGIILLDLDHFKNINDGLGHDAGDAFLMEVGTRLSHNTRDCDTVARVSEDEFGVLVELDENASMTDVAESLLQAFRNPITLYDTEVVITASLGIATYPEAGDSTDSLIKAADVAMYQAKERGRNNYQVYGEGSRQQALGRLQLETSLRHGLERNEFVLHFQPQVDIAGQLVSAEALMRWSKTGADLVSPAAFIPILESTGLIVAVGAFALETACRQLKTWRAEGHEIRGVSVNVSARQFEHGDLVETVRGALEGAQLAATDLELEITESVLMKDTERARAVLIELANMGVRIAVDDFGTGYSSLAYLHKFPVHCLKIDRAFVKNIGIDPQCESIVGSVVALAHRLNMVVVAEGVETIEQRNYLANEGCDLIQGFLYGRPVAGDVMFQDQAKRRAQRVA